MEVAGWILSAATVWAMEKQKSMCVTQEAGSREENIEKIRGQGKVIWFLKRKITDSCTQ